LLFRIGGRYYEGQEIYIWFRKPCFSRDSHGQSKAEWCCRG
jgi:hypothetical protein